MKVKLTEKQKKEFERLWWIYGNGGKKHTLMNHKLVQGFVECGENRIMDYRDVNKNMLERFGEEHLLNNGITDECLAACREVLANP